jgi:hypothetical protein
VAALFRRQGNVATHAELTAEGLAPSTVTRRQRARGPWTNPFPGVVIGHSGTPTPDERGRAALKYAGRGAVLTGLSALRRLGFRCPAGEEHALVPHERHRQSYAGLLVERTRRSPRVVVVRGMPCAATQRALFDACRRLSQLDEVRELVAHVIQSGGCTVEAFGAEVDAGARGRSALSREVLEEVGAGVRSAAEARVRALLRRGGLPTPRWNVDIIDAHGRFIGCADAVWSRVGVVLELDSMAWHLAPAQYRRTQKRQRRLAIPGLLVLPASPGEIFADPERFVADVREALLEGAKRPPPMVTYRARPADR